MLDSCASFKHSQFLFGTLTETDDGPRIKKAVLLDCIELSSGALSRAYYVKLFDKYK